MLSDGVSCLLSRINRYAINNEKISIVLIKRMFFLSCAFRRMNAQTRTYYNPSKVSSVHTWWRDACVKIILVCGGNATAVMTLKLMNCVGEREMYASVIARRTHLCGCVCRLVWVYAWCNYSYIWYKLVCNIISLIENFAKLLSWQFYNFQVKFISSGE